jgi:hypothetical protein
VRLSSNFPFGFRVSEVKVPRGARAFVHVLDGGVVDNTGLDTIYELCKALQRHADAASSPYRGRARAALEGLRRRGVVLLEIDAGAKPAGTTPWRFDPLGGPREPLQGLDNASYTNAEVVKQLYVNEVRRALTRDQNVLRGLAAEASAPPGDFPEQLAGATAMHLVFQCNHYLPGQKAQDPEVMTAWALGPRDKAQIVQRFLIELEVWDQHRRDAYYDVRRGLAEHRRLEALALEKNLLRELRTIQRRTDELGKGLLAGNNRQELRQSVTGLMEDVVDLGPEIMLTDEGVKRAWEAVGRETQRTGDLLAAPPPPPATDVTSAATALWKKGGAFLDDLQVRKAEMDLDRKVEEALNAQQGRRQDPQKKYDLSANRTKAILEAPAPR